LIYDELASILFVVYVSFKELTQSNVALPLVRPLHFIRTGKNKPMADDKSSIFVGRQAQLSALKAYWRNTFHKNQGSVIFLAGEAGIGKTTLIEQFSQNILKYYPGVQYAYAQCDQVAGDVSPYAPFVQILNDLTRQAAKKGDNWFVDYVREIGPDILGMVPAVGSLLSTTAKSVDFVWKRRHQKDEPPEQLGQLSRKILC
jgi:Cdc6-like AAA superfamily ATPase